MALVVVAKGWVPGDLWIPAPGIYRIVAKRHHVWIVWEYPNWPDRDGETVTVEHQQFTATMLAAGLSD